MKPFYEIGAYLSRSSVERKLLDLVYFRVSQMNGCAYCLDMHSKDLRAEGETEQRLYMLEAWRESSLYSERERAALAWAESVTFITDGHVPDSVFEEVQSQFSEAALIDLTIAILGINSFNRINVAFRMPSGTYQVGQHAVVAN